MVDYIFPNIFIEEKSIGIKLKRVVLIAELRGDDY